jgi:hypothetical protein
MRQRQRRAIKKFADPFRSLNLRRKRLAAVIAGLKSRTRRYKKHRRYNRASWDWWMRFIDPDTNDTEFRKFYRLPKAVFDAVLCRITQEGWHADIRLNKVKQEAAGGGVAAVEPETMLAVTLRWLAGWCVPVCACLWLCVPVCACVYLCVPVCGPCVHRCAPVSMRLPMCARSALYIVLILYLP